MFLIPMLLAVAVVAAAVDLATDVAASPDLMGLAAIISAIGVPVATVVSAVVLVTARRTDRKVTQIDHAVNGKAEGKLPMVDQVEDLHDEIPGRKASIEQAALLPLVRRLVELAEAEAETDE